MSNQDNNNRKPQYVRMSSSSDDVELMPASQRTVVFFDILGFREKLKLLGAAKLYQLYRHIVGYAKNYTLRRDIPEMAMVPRLFGEGVGGRNLCGIKIFSDSIIMFSLEHTEESALKTLACAWRVMQTFIAAKLPIRGGCAFGEIIIDETEDVFLGGGLTKAYELEHSQQWIGAAVDNSIADAFPSILSMPMFFLYDVPMKNGGRERFFTLNWRKNMTVEKGTSWLFESNGDSEVGLKITNTLEYAKAVRNSGAWLQDNGSLPLELKAFWVGASEPPFPHGDEY